MRSNLAPVDDPAAWRAIRMLYVGSALLFLATITIGILNVFTEGELSRGQVLSHFHSGSIGWVTLSVIATALWMYAGGRQVGPSESSLLQLLAGVGLIAVAGYIAAFVMAFNGGRTWMLPLFGIPAGLVIITTFGYLLARAKHQATLTTPHLLMIGALAIASLGALMGVLVGLSHADVVHLFPAGADMVASHAGPMDMYLALAFAAVAEMFLGGGGRWSRWGLTQMVLGTLSGVVAWLALLLDIGPAVPLALLLFLVAFIIYFARIGWRALKVPPTRGRAPAVFFGGLAFPLYIGMFVYLVATYFSQGQAPPHVPEVVFVHVTFVGMATNWILAAQSAWTEGSRVLARLEPIAIWTTNVGLAVFLLGVTQGRREGALLLAVGILLAWIVIVVRGVQADEPGSRLTPTMG